MFQSNIGEKGDADDVYGSHGEVLASFHIPQGSHVKHTKC